MVRGVNRVLFALFACSLLLACKASEGVIIADVDYFGWKAGSVARMEYLNEDTVGVRSISILVRRNALLGYDDTRFTIETTSPSKKYISESITIPLGRKSASHQGFMEIEVPYRLKSVLREKGMYKFYISHGGESLVGVQGVGVVIK